MEAIMFSWTVDSDKTIDYYVKVYVDTTWGVAIKGWNELNSNMI